MRSVEQRVLDALARLAPTLDEEVGDWENVLRRVVIRTSAPDAWQRCPKVSGASATGLADDAVGWGTRPLGRCAGAQSFRSPEALGWGTRPL